MKNTFTTNNFDENGILLIQNIPVAAKKLIRQSNTGYNQKS